MAERQGVNQAPFRRITAEGRFQFLGNHLQVSRNLGIIDMKNKNAAACRCANTRKPAQVIPPPTQRPLAAPHGILYDIPALPARGGFAVVFSCLRCIRAFASCAVWEFLLHGVFVFRPAPAGAKAPGVLRWKQKEAEIYEISTKICIITYRHSHIGHISFERAPHKSER